MRKLILVIFVISCCLRSQCQQYVARLNTDSLKKVLLSAKDTQRANTLNLLSKRILFGRRENNSIDTAALLAGQALKLSRDLKYDKGLGNAMLNQAMVANSTGADFSQTLSSLQPALALLKNAKDWFSIANCYGVCADCYHFLGRNRDAITYLDSAVNLFQALGDTVSSVWSIVSEAHSYADLGNFTEAYKRFHSAQNLTAPTDTLLLGFLWCQTAALFLSAELPEIALDYVNKARALYPISDAGTKMSGSLEWATKIAGEAFLQLKQTDSALRIAHELNVPIEAQRPPQNLFYGNLAFAMGQYKKALLYFNRGYSTSRHTSYAIGHALHAIGLATAYLKLNKFPEVIRYAKEALDVSKRMHFLRQEKDAVGTLSEVYAATGNYSKAYFYSQLYKSLTDSLAPEQYKRKIALIQVKDELEMQKKEAKLLSTQNEISRQRINLQESSLRQRSLLMYTLMGALIVIIVLVILISRNIKLKRRKVQLQVLMEQVNAQQKVAELEKEKTDLEMQALRAQMNPHFIFNCLSSINRYILHNKTEEASDYLTKFSRLIRMTLHNSEKTLISLESDLEALRLYLDLERLRFKNAFNYKITFMNSIDVDTLFIPPMLLQPFAENAIWHGLMHKKGTGSLEIQLAAEDKTLSCMIIDDGIGRNQAAAFAGHPTKKDKSMGVSITSGRLALLNKSKDRATVFEIEDLRDAESNDRGTRVILKIPYKELTEVYD